MPIFLDHRTKSLCVVRGVAEAETWKVDARDCRTERSMVFHKNGGIEHSKFLDYQMLRMPEMPKVEVHIVPSTEKPGGVGEPGVPPVAPVVANTIFAATGKRIRKLSMIG